MDNLYDPKRKCLINLIGGSSIFLENREIKFNFVHLEWIG